LITAKDRGLLTKEMGKTTHVDAVQTKTSESLQEERAFQRAGHDVRAKVKSTTKLPYSAIGLLVMTFDNGTYIGTGAVVGKNIILTAAHNLYSHEISSEPRIIRFLPGENGGDSFFEPTIARFHIPEEYKTSKKEDYAIIVLNEPLGDSTGYLEMTPVPPQQLHGKEVSVGGYPSDKIIDKISQWVGKGDIKSVDSDFITYWIDTGQGQSGSPVFFQEDNQYKVVGVHVLGDELERANKATLLTQARIDWINNKSQSQNECARVDKSCQEEESKRITHEFFEILAGLPWRKIARGAFKVAQIAVNELTNETAMLTEAKQDEVARASDNMLKSDIGTSDQKRSEEETKGVVNPVGKAKPWIATQEVSSLGHIAGIEIKQLHLEGMKTIDREKAKVFLMLGETGAGKSTLVNAMANYLLSTQFKDKFRYKLVPENPQANQAKSQTKGIHEYGFKETALGCPLLLIDCQGFGDTAGVQADQDLKALLFDYILKQIPNIHAICFVMKASQNRLTIPQRYVLENILSLFGKDAANHISMMFTFADSGDPQAHSALLEAKVPYDIAQCFKFNNSGLFPQVSQKYDVSDTLLKAYWKMGVKSIEKFFKSVQNRDPIHLQTTQRVISLRKQLEIAIFILNQKRDEGLIHLHNFQSTLHQLQVHKAEIEENKNFEYIETIPDFSKQPTTNHTTYCPTCNFTCHHNCAYANDSDKAKCEAMKNGTCIRCKNKCHWSKHMNIPFIIVVSSKTTKKTFAKMKERYDTNLKGFMLYKHIVKDIEEKFKDGQMKVYSVICSAQALVMKLNEIALYPSSTDTRQYLSYLIQNEEEQKHPGWVEKVHQLKNLQSLYDVQGKIEQGETKLEDVIGEQWKEWQKGVEECDKLCKEIEEDSTKLKAGTQGGRCIIA
jgi:V8-like Glu-specific endopeptidase/GTP-binding protein EngB required for normal cell division